MKKKTYLTILFFTCLWMFCTLITMAETYSGTVLYGGFEEPGKPGVVPTKWTVYPGPWENNFVTSTEHVKEGIFSLKTTIREASDEIPRALNQSAPYWGDFDTSAKYELSIWVFIPEGSDSKGAYLLPRLYNEDGTESSYVYPVRSEYIKGDTDGEWVKTSVVFKPHRKIGALEGVFIRCEAGTVGTIYWDDLQLHKLNADGSYADIVPPKDFPEDSDVLLNGNLKETDGSGTSITAWSASGEWGEGAVVQKNGDGTNTAVYLKGQPSHIYQHVNAVGGDTFTLRLRYKTDEKGSAAIKFGFRSKEGKEFASHSTRSLPKTYGKWIDFSYDITVPENTARLELLLRKYTDGDVFYSDVSLYKKKPTPLLTVRTDNDTTFYYSDWQTGEVTVTLNTDPDGKTVVLYLKNREQELYRVEKQAEETLSFSFPVSEMQVKTEYILTAELRGTGGILLDTATKPIYSFHRPTALHKNGQLTLGGETISPVFGYHVQKDEDLAAAKAAGVNVVQGIGSFEDGSMGRFLDKCWENYRIRVFLCLYQGNMLPAGHPINRERTKAIIDMYKGHPAVAGYMIQDEPYLQNFYNPEGVSAQLLDSYLLIRSLDDEHPVYVTADYGSSSYYRNIGNACDIIAPDDYPLTGDRSLASLYENMKAVNAAVRGRKPMYAILQIYEDKGSGVRQPTMDELAHMVYQSLLAGADAVGYYSFGTGQWKFSSSALYEPLCTFNKVELPLLYGAIQSECRYVETNENGTILRKYADGTSFGVNLLEEEMASAALLPEQFIVIYGEGNLSASADGVKITLPPHGRFFGNTTLPDFGDTLVISEEVEGKMITYKNNGKKVMPDNVKLIAAAYEEHGGIKELVDFAVGKTSVTIAQPKSDAAKIVIMMVDISDVCPIYKKEEISNK